MAELDFGALDWVRGEIEENLKNARQALEAYVETPDDSTRIRHCLHQLHQVNSVLGMLQLSGVGVLSAEMRDLAQALMNSEVGDVERAHEALMQGMIHLPLVLERVQREAKDDRDLVVGLANDLRVVRGATPLAGGRSADIDLSPLEADSDPEARSRFERRGGVMVSRKARTAYQRALVGCVRQTGDAAPRVAMLRVCNGLVKLCDQTPVGRFCVLLAGFVETLGADRDNLKSEDLSALRQVDSLLKRLVRNGASGLAQLPPAQLSRTLAERLLLSNGTGPAVRAARELLGLSPSGGSATGLLDDRDARRAVAVNLRDEVASVKDRLDLYVRSEVKNSEDLDALGPTLTQMSSTMALLGAESLRALIDEQLPLLESFAGQESVSEAALLEVAAALVAVDGGLEAMISTGATDAASAQVQEVHRVVLGEVRRGLQDVKDAVTDFEASRWEHERLRDVPGLLENVRGGLVMIPLERAAAVVARCQAYVGHLTERKVVPQWEVFDRFTEAISGIEYFVERLMETSGRQDTRVLEYAEESAHSLLAAGDDEALTVFDVPSVDLEAAADERSAAGAGLHSAPPQIPLESEVPVDEPASSWDTMTPAETAADDTFGAPASSAAPAEPDLADATAQAAAAETRTETGTETAAALPADDHDPLGPDLLDGLLDTDVGRPFAGDQADDGELLEPDEALSAGSLSLQDDLAGFATPEAAPSTADRQAPATAGAVPEVDPDILEVFVEEVDEVLEVLHASLPQWIADPGNQPALGEVRRAFHTLKGSGRMVGAEQIGELSWSVENLLNRVLEGTVQPGAEVFNVITDVLRILPGMREAFAHGLTPEGDYTMLAEQADLLASGGQLAELDGAPDDDEFDPEALAAADAEDRTLVAAGDGGADASLELAADAEMAALFAAEARGHVEQLRAFAGELQAAGDLQVTDAAYRAAHTLFGSAAMAGVTHVMAVAEPLEQVLERWLRLDTALPEALREVLSDAIDCVAEAVEDGPQAFAVDGAGAERARRVRAALHSAGAEPGAGSSTPRELLDLHDIELVVDADTLLRQWQDGVPDMLQLGRLEAVTRALAEQAAQFGLGDLATLCTGLVERHADLSPDVGLLRDGHVALVAGLDALAIDQAPLVDAGLLARFVQAPADTADVDAVAGGAQDHLLVADLEVPEATATLPVEGPEPPPEQLDELEVPELLEDLQLGDDLAQAELVAPDDLSDAAGALQLEAEFGEQLPGPDELPLEPEAPPAQLDEADEYQQLPNDGLAAEPAGAQPGTPQAATRSATGAPDAAQATALAIAELGALPADADADILEVFFEEASEICESIDQSVHEWSAAPDNAVYLETLLRGLHTLKGGARMTGMTPLGDATHAIESELVAFQEGAGIPDSNFLNSLQVRLDRIVGAVAHAQALARGEPAPEALAGVDPAGALAAPLPPVSAGVDEPVDADVRPEPAAAAEADAASEAAVHRTPPQEMIRVSSGVLEALVNLAGEASITRARIEQEISDFGGSLEELESTIERVREQLRRLEIEMEAQVLFREERTERQAHTNFDPLEMDRYSQVQALTRSLSESASDLLDLKETLTNRSRDAETLLLQQARTNTELQEGLMRTRMVPFARLLPRLRRIVRQIGRELRKEVEFEASEAEGELDRNVLERMIAPLEHMLRNAVDHGIETPDERLALGKPRAGRIELSLTREGGDVVLALRDDGAGVNVDAVRARAQERGLMAADARMTDEEIMQFVLAPGFSTASAVTQISGRGVGMDVVHSEVKQLGGSVSIGSERGRGTTITVRLPFTVSVNRALMVSVGEDVYAIPLNMIEGIVRAAPQELASMYEVTGAPFDYAGERYQLRYLGTYLGRHHAIRQDVLSLPVILVRSGEQTMALHVDAVQGSREIVVKSLGPQFAGVGGISGATILGDGSVVVILDLLAMIRNYAPGDEPDAPAEPAQLPTCVLVVDDSVTVRKVTSRLLERRGFEVLLAKDGVEAVAQLQERRPDVMLLDIEMPRMDGFEVARHVREDARLESLPIVMISSRSGSKHQERARELGVNRFLGKPFQEKELLEIIDALVLA